MELKRILQSSPKFRDYPFKKHYSGVCQLCREICGNPEAVQELRERLSAPAETAMRLAQQQVKTAARGDLWNRDAVNSKEARRAVFLVLSKEPEKNRTGIDQILGRADMDWYRLAEMIVANGLAARVLQRREHLASYAPSLFWPFLHHGAAPWNATAEPLEELLLQWRRSDFENILTLAVLLEENPELLEQLKRDHSPLGRLALFLLLSNGLTSRPEAPIQSRTRLTRIRYGLGQTVLQARGVGRLNFLVKPLLQVLCLPGGGMGLGIRALIRDLKASFRVRGWKETLLLLAKDFWRAIVAGQKICSVRK